jgi:hypothetical protein
VETLTDADADRADGRGSAVDASRDASASVDDWLATLAANPPFDELLSVPEPERRARGYGDTLREICQQPLTWPRTAEVMASAASRIREALVAGGVADRTGGVVLTGSGSSFFGCECAAAPLQETLGVVVRAVARERSSRTRTRSSRRPVRSSRSRWRAPATAPRAPRSSSGCFDAARSRRC